MNRARLPLRRVFPAFVLGLAVTLMVLAGWLDFGRTNRAVERGARRRTMAVGNLVVPDLERAMSRGQTGEIEAHLARLAIIPDVARVLVLGETNQWLFGVAPGAVPMSEVSLDPAQRALVERARARLSAQWVIPEGRRVLQAAFPFSLGLVPGELRASRSGVLFIESDLAFGKAAEWGGNLERSAAMGVATVVLCLLGWVYFERTYTRRLNRLVAGLASYDVEPGGTRFAEEGGDELARIGQALNRMTGEVESRRAAVQESESRKAAILGSMRDGLVSLDDGGFVLDWNGAAERIFGVSRTDALGKLLVDLVVPPTLRPQYRADLARAMESLETSVHAVVEWQASRADGAELPVEVAITRTHGMVTWYTVLLIDLTERRRVDEALRAKDRLLRTVIDLVPHFIFAKDEQGRYLFVNRSSASAQGLEPDSMAGRTDRELSRVPVEAHALMRDDAEVLRTGRAKMIDAETLTNVSGDARIYQTVKIPFENPATGRPAILGVAVDITEARRSALALKQSEERFRELADHIQEVFWIAGVDHREIHYVSPAFERVWGRRLDELKENPRVWFDAIHPEDRASLEVDLHRGPMGEGWHREYRILRPDGEIRWIHDRAFPVHDEHGTVVRYVGVAEDVTEQREAELERARLATALEQTAEAVLITDLGGAIQYVNPAFERITGYSRGEVIGGSPRILKSGAHDAAFYEELKAVLLRGETWKGRFINRRKDGSRFEQEATITPVRDAAGRVVNYFEIARDITREVELEEQLRHAQKMEAIGQLAGGVAHDFNNLLAVITMQVSLLEAEAQRPEDLAESLSEIRNAADRATALTRQLLLFSRRQVMQARVLDLNEAVSGLARLLQRLIGADVHLEIVMSPEAIQIHADSGMLDQVLMNLAINARDAMPEGGTLRIETGWVDVSEATPGRPMEAVCGRYARVVVSDTGFGIRAEVMPRIFEPFFTTKDVGEGTGLGLATVFGVVKQHQGWVNVQSRPGGGTSFEVILPAGPRTASPGVTAVISPNETARPIVRRGSGERILLVEDEPNVRQATAKVLERHGYRVWAVPDGVTGLVRWQELGGAIDLVLTDLVMPGGLNGLQLGRKLREMNPALRVIFTSGYSADTAGKRSQPDAGEEFLQKPVDMQCLLATVRRVLDSRSSGETRVAGA